MKAYNEKKAKILYDYLDESKMFHGTVAKRSFLLMFLLSQEDQETGR